MIFDWTQVKKTNKKKKIVINLTNPHMTLSRIQWAQIWSRPGDCELPWGTLENGTLRDVLKKKNIG